MSTHHSEICHVACDQGIQTWALQGPKVTCMWPGNPNQCNLHVLKLLSSLLICLLALRGNFHSTLKQSNITPILKNLLWTKNSQTMYYLNRSVISKIRKCVVKSRLTEHLCINNLWNHHQSAYCRLSITLLERLSCTSITTSSMPQAFKIWCIFLLDLSAAFDTIDHNILLSCLLSCCGID